ncbi:hypothetical protein AURDEDRAFT_178476 [Auricularia subglabra TFB-10046 SS5]|uniref:Uncharacterized protein n=1 Tax=Auricularia subglabra (strain TFB-10046 / SS5) TaxID=717982 RepID=J0CQI8_AURST|nr:hypothetical protein AURDEDRAFT_178476 [Auricularia subglabra TFB-10046 SS5]
MDVDGGGEARIHTADSAARLPCFHAGTAAVCIRVRWISGSEPLLVDIGKSPSFPSFLPLLAASSRRRRNFALAAVASAFALPATPPGVPDDREFLSAFTLCAVAGSHQPSSDAGRSSPHPSRTSTPTGVSALEKHLDELFTAVALKVSSFLLHAVGCAVLIGTLLAVDEGPNVRPTVSGSTFHRAFNDVALQSFKEPPTVC